MNRSVVMSMVVAVLAVAPSGAPAQGLPVAAAPARNGMPLADTTRVLTLPDAMRLALDRNRDLRVARLTLRNARDRVDEAWGSLLPKVDASTSYTHNFELTPVFIPGVIAGQPEKDLVPVTFGAKHSWQFSLDASQPLFDPAAFVGVGAAGRYEALQSEVVRGTAHTVATAARIGYYDALLAEESVRLNRESLARVQQALEETEAMRRAGLTSEFETLRLKVELSNVQSDLRRAENAAVAARRALTVQLGLDPATPVRTAGSLASLELEPDAEQEPGNRALLETVGLPRPEQQPDSELVALARARRSDLRQLELTRSLRQTDVRLEKLSYLPKISLFGTYSIAAQKNTFDFFGGREGPRGYGQVAGVRVTVPIFSGFQRLNRIQQKQDAVDQVRVQYEQARDQAEQQVETLRDDVLEARQRAGAQRQSVEQAQRGYRIASAEYREGIGSRLQLTDAEVSLRRAEFNYAQAVYDYLVARARLDQAVGVVPLAADRD